jgi:hypothetical protein
VFEEDLADLTAEPGRQIEFEDILDLEPLCVNSEFAFGLALRAWTCIGSLFSFGIEENAPSLTSKVTPP